LLVGVPPGLILKQPIWAGRVLIPMLVVAHFWRGLQWQTRARVSLAGIFAGALFLFSHQQANPQAVSAGRITSFLHPEEDAKGAGYQL